MTKITIDYLLDALNLDNKDQLDEVISELNKAKEELLNSNNPNSNIKLGSTIIDIKHHELGIFIGPLDVFGKKKYTAKYTTKSIEDQNTYLIITLTNNFSSILNSRKNITDPSSSIKSSYEDNNIFRVRYVKKKDIIIIESNKSSVEEDFNYFCNYQCVMCCSEECKLFKYKKTTT